MLLFILPPSIVLLLSCPVISVPVAHTKGGGRRNIIYHSLLPHTRKGSFFSVDPDLLLPPNLICCSQHKPPKAHLRCFVYGRKVVIIVVPFRYFFCPRCPFITCRHPSLYSQLNVGRPKSSSRHLTLLPGSVSMPAASLVCFGQGVSLTACCFPGSLNFFHLSTINLKMQDPLAC